MEQQTFLQTKSLPTTSAGSDFQYSIYLCQFIRHFLYTVEWVEQDADGGYWTGECWSYTDGDAQPVKLDVPWIDWQCIRAINPQGTHGLFETEVENNWWNYRVMPLDSIT